MLAGMERTIARRTDAAEEALRASEARNADVIARMETTIAERTEALSATNRELEAFVWSVSHDLRAPLRIIDGYCAILEEDAGPMLDDVARGHLQRVRAAAQRMGQLVDDLLRLSRVSRGELACDEVDVTGMAEEVNAALAVSEPGRAVDFQVEPGLRVWADARLLRIVLENLLSNARKFTRGRNPAHVRVFRRPDGAVVVEDDGVGFEPAQAGRLFAPFQRLHPPQPFEGTGIGLAIVQRVVLRHGGQVGAEGTPGVGARFWFRLEPPQVDQAGVCRCGQTPARSQRP
jgi:signal transduction histidine kinase